MAYHMLTRAGFDAAQQEIERRYQAIGSKKDRYEFLQKKGWERLRVDTLERTDAKTGEKIKYFVVIWKHPKGSRELRQSLAIRAQIQADMVMAGEIVWQK